MVDTLIGFGVGGVIGAVVSAIVLRIIRAKRAHPRLPRGWTMVALKRPFDIAEAPEIWEWLDEHCEVPSSAIIGPYKRSHDWFMLDGKNNYAIRDRDIAFQFKMRWA